MKSFDPGVICPKCGHKEIKVCHMEKVEYSSDYLREYKEDSYPLLKEHLRRECLRCHFAWPENIVKEIKTNNDLINKIPFHLSPSLDGAPDIIIVDRNGTGIGDLYTTREEAEEIINIINSYCAVKGN